MANLFDLDGAAFMNELARQVRNIDRSSYPYGYVVEATSEVAKHLEQRAKKGEQGGLPEMVPAAFLEDVAQWCVVWMHHEYGHEGDRSALNFQEDLCDHWPAAWILWMFQSIGYIKYTDAI